MSDGMGPSGWDLKTEPSCQPPPPHTGLSCQPHPTHFCNNRAYRMSTFLCNLGRWDDAWKESWSPVATGMFAMQAIIMSGHLHSMNLDIRNYNGLCNTATMHIAEHLPRNQISRKSQPLTHTQNRNVHILVQTSADQK